MLQSLTRPLAAAVVTAVLAVTTAACGADGDAEPAQAARTAPNGDVYVDADVEFATGMIPHHAQALQMVELTRGRELDPQVARLADAIRTAQVPEVEAMADWLTSWGEKVPATSMDHLNAGHDMEDMHGMGDAASVPGMMSAEDMERLGSASDAEFQDLWLQMMVEHHRGAVAMARTEQEQGRFRSAVRLAASIDHAQQAEISRMEKLLDS